MTSPGILGSREVQAAVVGGSLLAGGGGGSMAEGQKLGNLAVELGGPRLISIDEVPDDALVVTVSAVGAPAAREAFVRPMDYVRALELLKDSITEELYGIITSENGGAATVNGWLQGTVLNLPVIDAACNGRAHPTGLMGAMGLHKEPSYISCQAAVGGNPAQGRHVSLYTQGALERCSALVRQAAVQAGGVVAVARNPVSARYVKEKAAPGAITHALEVGEKVLAARASGAPGEAVARVAAKAVGGELVARGKVTHRELKTEGGFDSGRILIDDRTELTFWNEYITLEVGGQRWATFPDLIATLDGDTGLPLTSAEIRRGTDVYVLVSDRANLRLGAGMFDAGLFKSVEEITGKGVIGR